MHARRADARPALAAIMNNLGYLSLLRDQPEAARETCREAAALFEELGFGEEAAGAWLNAASAEISLGDLIEARAALDESLDRYAALQHAEGLSYGLETAAAIAARSGDAHRAAVLVGAAAADPRTDGRHAAAVGAAPARRDRGARRRSAWSRRRSKPPAPKEPRSPWSPRSTSRIKRSVTLLRISDPGLLQLLRADLQSRDDLVAEIVDDRTLRVDILGSYGEQGMQLATTLRVQAWVSAQRARGVDVSVEILD